MSPRFFCCHLRGICPAFRIGWSWYNNRNYSVPSQLRAASPFMESEIIYFAYYNAPRGCARICKGNMRQSPRKSGAANDQSKNTFVVCYNIHGLQGCNIVAKQMFLWYTSIRTSIRKNKYRKVFPRPLEPPSGFGRRQSITPCRASVSQASEKCI